MPPVVDTVLSRQEKESERTDQELIAAANAGDLAGFESIYFRYRWRKRHDRSRRASGS